MECFHSSSFRSWSVRKFYPERNMTHWCCASFIPMPARAIISKQCTVYPCTRQRVPIRSPESRPHSTHYPPAGPPPDPHAHATLLRQGILTTSCGVSFQSERLTAQAWHLFGALKNLASSDRKSAFSVLSRRLLHNSEPTAPSAESCGSVEAKCMGAVCVGVREGRGLDRTRCTSDL